MSKCWYCGKELKNENYKEHIGICDECYQESFKVGNTVLTKLIKYKTDKDQKIADLEAKLAKTQNELSAKVEYINELVVVKDNYKKQLTLTEKALELACETYWNDCGMEDCPADIMDNFSDTYKKCKTCPNCGDRFVNDKGCCWVDYFKYKAKEVMKSE